MNEFPLSPPEKTDSPEKKEITINAPKAILPGKVVSFFLKKRTR
jgi:hypothetical protein